MFCPRYCETRAAAAVPTAVYQERRGLKAAAWPLLRYAHDQNGDDAPSCPSADTPSASRSELLATDQVVMNMGSIYVTNLCSTQEKFVVYF